MTATFATNLVHFVRHLRGRGLSVVPATSRDLAAAIAAVGLVRRDDVYYALRSLVVMHLTEREKFDEAFELFFGEGQVQCRSDESMEDAALIPRCREVSRSEMLLHFSGRDVDQDNDAQDFTDVVGASYHERLSHRDFRELTFEETIQVRRLIARMTWRPADALSRRWAPAKRGLRTDFRRTFRSMVTCEGDLLPLALSNRKLRRRPLVILADISGSMERYTEMFLHFMHAMEGRLGRLEAFVFATRLSRITRQMRAKLPDVALNQVSRVVDDWAGGTRIGQALETFNQDWGRRVSRGGAIGLIISDGWDTGEPDLLEREMFRFSRSMHRVIWLNPLASRPGFSPETRGLRVALPYVDDFLAAGSLVDFRTVIRLLESVPDRPAARKLLPLRYVAEGGIV